MPNDLGAGLIENDQRLHKEIAAGMALFLSMYYVLTANPAILGLAGVPIGAALLGTFVVVILGNILSARITGTGLIIAPAVGISAFFADFVANTRLTWEYAMLGTLVAGLLICVISFFTDWRQQIIDSLPPPVRKATKAAIGALLVSAGLDIYRDSLANSISPVNGEVHLPKPIALVIAVGMIAIFVSFAALRQRRASRPYQGKRDPWSVTLLLHLEFVVGVGLGVVALYVLAPGYIEIQPSFEALQIIWFPDLLNSGSFTVLDITEARPDWVEFGLLFFAFVFVVVAIVITDIPGTPPEVLDRVRIGPNVTIDNDQKTLVRNGFRNDAAFSAIAPVIGTTPSIYYAENLILREIGSFSARIGYVVAFLFSICFFLTVLAVYFDYEHLMITKLLPVFIVSPVVIYIGLLVIAMAYNQGDDRENPVSGKPLLYYMPTSVAVILTPFLGVQFSFPAAILVYWMFCPVGEMRSESRDRSCIERDLRMNLGDSRFDNLGTEEKGQAIDAESRTRGKRNAEKRTYACVSVLAGVCMFVYLLVEISKVL
ncbi:MAG: hypothetical protein RIC87_02965 [Kiloniellales bacterium]